MHEWAQFCQILGRDLSVGSVTLLFTGHLLSFFNWKTSTERLNDCSNGKWGPRWPGWTKMCKVISYAKHSKLLLTKLFQLPLVDQPPASPTAARCECVIKLPLNVSGDTIYFDNSEETVVYFKLHANLFPTPAIKGNSSSSLPALLPQGRSKLNKSWNSRLWIDERFWLYIFTSRGLNHLLALYSLRLSYLTSPQSSFLMVKCVSLCLLHWLTKGTDEITCSKLRTVLGHKA